jgi:Protein of unknown function (DUF3105)
MASSKEQKVVAAAVVVGVVAAVMAGCGNSAKPVAPKGGVKGLPIPRQSSGDLAAAANAAGCTVRTFPNYGNDHTTAKVLYKTNPPTSGDHDPTWAHDGDYVGQPSRTVGMQVHTLEHGRVDIQYAPRTPRRRQRQLETLLSETFGGQPAGFDQLLFQNTTRMPYAVAATAWTHLVGCPKFNDKVFDALRTFRAKYAGHGPEHITFPE